MVMAVSLRFLPVKTEVIGEECLLSPNSASAFARGSRPSRRSSRSASTSRTSFRPTSSRRRAVRPAAATIESERLCTGTPPTLPLKLSPPGTSPG